jgi:hypothetical protein
MRLTPSAASGLLVGVVAMAPVTSWMTTTSTFAPRQFSSTVSWRSFRRTHSSPSATKRSTQLRMYSEVPVYGEESRKYRRMVYTHDDWVKHRSPDRYWNNLKTTTKSGIYKVNLRKRERHSTFVVLVSEENIHVLYFSCIVFVFFVA